MSSVVGEAEPAQAIRGGSGGDEKPGQEREPGAVGERIVSQVKFDGVAAAGDEDAAQRVIDAQRFAGDAVDSDAPAGEPGVGEHDDAVGGGVELETRGGRVDIGDGDGDWRRVGVARGAEWQRRGDEGGGIG